ncbi:MAG TPA: hypothetical protein VE967_10075 [Gemmatimonadaceae bacterium]|nr:hypothetical protein [Gemmatimonadaceae bacterium]
MPTRNEHPWRVAILLAIGLFIATIAAGVAISSTKTGPEQLGAGYACVLPGCIALGVWAKRSPRRWTTTEWALRAFVCLLVSGVVMAGLALASQIGTPAKQRP